MQEWPKVVENSECGVCVPRGVPISKFKNGIKESYQVYFIESWDANMKDRRYRYSWYRTSRNIWTGLFVHQQISN